MKINCGIASKPVRMGKTPPILSEKLKHRSWDSNQPIDENCQNKWQPQTEGGGPPPPSNPKNTATGEDPDRNQSLPYIRKLKNEPEKEKKSDENPEKTETTKEIEPETLDPAPNITPIKQEISQKQITGSRPNLEPDLNYRRPGMQPESEFSIETEDTFPDPDFLEPGLDYIDFVPDGFVYNPNPILVDTFTGEITMPGEEIQELEVEEIPEQIPSIPVFVEQSGQQFTHNPEPFAQSQTIGQPVGYFNDLGYLTIEEVPFSPFESTSSSETGSQIVAENLGEPELEDSAEITAENLGEPVLETPAEIEASSGIVEDAVAAVASNVIHEGMSETNSSISPDVSDYAVSCIGLGLLLRPMKDKLTKVIT